MSTEWDAERIAELRRLAQEAVATERMDRSLNDYLHACDALDEALSGPVVLSLLDELESARRERDALMRDAGHLLEVADFALSEPGIVGTQTWLGAMEGVRARMPGIIINVMEEAE